MRCSQICLLWMTVCVLAIFPATSRSQACPSNAIASVEAGGADQAPLVTLGGNVHPLALPQYDRGPADGGMATGRMTLILKRSAQQDQDLTRFLTDVQNPHSASFRKFLTPAQFGQRFGANDASLCSAEAWLASYGLAVTRVHTGRTAIEFSGTVDQVQRAFHTAIHQFAIGGTKHWANVSEPQIPARLAAVVSGVASLNDFKPRSNVVKGPVAKWDAAQHRFIPQLTASSGSNTVFLMGPGDAATVYDTPNSLNSHFGSGQTVYDGTGVTIGVAGTTLLDDGGPIFYREFFGLPSTNNLSLVYDGDTADFSNNDDETEAILDTEVAGALAPGATVIYYGAVDSAFQSGLFLAIYRALDDNNVNILNVSYSECEQNLGASGNLQVLNAWEQAAAQGITVTVSTGDDGSAGCDNQNTVTAAVGGLAVNGLASTPYNIAVGGTDFDILSGNFATYVAGSSATAPYTTALSYIPENPWNDSTSKNGALASNVARSNNGSTSIWAGSGGASSAGNNGTSGYAKPAWQQNFSPSNTDAVRDLPDVSLLAADGLYGALWALCEGDYGDCSHGAGSTIHGVGGTSASAPAFAGILALVNQKMGASTRLGQADWVLYDLAAAAPSAFHQIKTGNNSVVCTAGSPGCGGNDFMTGYNAGSSYNLATGLGSVDVTNLIQAWGDDSLSATSTSLTLNQTTFTHGTTVNISSTVTPAATGNVAIETNYASQAAATGSAPPTMLTLSGGTAAGTFSQFPGGSYNVYANYGGDGSHAGSVSQPVKVTVSPENSVTHLAIYSVSSSGQLTNVTGTTVPLGTLVSINARPIGVSQESSSNPISNATGTMSFTDSGNVLTAYPVSLDSTGLAEYNLDFAAAGAHSVSASYSGDLSYNSSSAGAVSFNIAQGATTISAATTSASVTNGEQGNVTAQVSTTIPNNSLGLTGTITFTDTTNNTVLGTANASIGFGCQPLPATYCVLTGIDISSTQLVSGANSIVASYGGDSNFLPSGNSPAITITCVAGCYNASGYTLGFALYSQSSSSVAAGGSVTTTVETEAGGGFAGNVNLTCSVAGANSGDQHIPTCSFNPAQVSITSNQYADSVLTINTTAPTTSALHERSKGNPFAGGALALALLACLGLPVRRFRRRYLLTGITLLLALSGISACGGSSGSSGGGGGGGGGGSTVPGTTADTYTVTLKGADAATGTVTAQDYVKFTVN